MALTRFGCLASRLVNRNLILQRISSQGFRTSSALKKDSLAGSIKKTDDDDDLDQPIKYSTSKAATWDPVSSRTGREDWDATPWYECWIVMASTAVFLIYFCILREENDIDELMYRDLSEHFEGEAKEAIIRSQMPYLMYQESVKARMKEARKDMNDGSMPHFQNRG